MRTATKPPVETLFPEYIGDVRYYVTKNERAPVVMVLDHWPATTGLMRSCYAGILIGTRSATADEIEAVESSPRFLAWRWPDLDNMLRAEREVLGDAFADKLAASIKEKQSLIDELLKVGSRKKRDRQQRLDDRKAERKAERKAARQAAKDRVQPTLF